MARNAPYDSVCRIPPLSRELRTLQAPALADQIPGQKLPTVIKILEWYRTPHPVVLNRTPYTALVPLSSRLEKLLTLNQAAQETIGFEGNLFGAKELGKEGKIE